MDFLTDLFTYMTVRDSLLVLLFLFAAFLIGLITGWMYWRNRLSEMSTRLNTALEHSGRLQTDFDSLQLRLKSAEDEVVQFSSDVDDYREKLRTCQAEKGQLSTQIQVLKEQPTPAVSPHNSPLVRTTDEASNGPDDLKRINGIGPKLEATLNQLGIFTYKQISGWTDAEANQMDESIGSIPGRILRDNWIGQARILELQKLENPGFNTWQPPADHHDLKIIEGIGPKIEKLLNARGIQTWKDLANTQVSQLRSILHSAGPNYRIHFPDTWPIQAAIAVKGDWEAFREYTDFLIGGRNPDEVA